MNRDISFDIKGLHHFAWRCRDAEETREFYEDVLGLPLVHLIRRDHVPSTGEYCPYVHIFFQMADGSCLAFFDLGDNETALPSPNTPEWVNHIALEVGSVEEVIGAKKRLEAAGVEVLGVTDHEIIKSVYFFDPNGFRVELTVPTVPQSVMDGHAAAAHGELERWVRERNCRAEGK